MTESLLLVMQWDLELLCFILSDFELWLEDFLILKLLRNQLMFPSVTCKFLSLSVLKLSSVPSFWPHF